LISAGMTPHQPISILQRVSGMSTECSAKSTVQLLLEQVRQLRQLKSRLSLEHQQVLSLSPPLRRQSVLHSPEPPLGVPGPGSPDSTSYSALLALLAQLPPSQLSSLEYQLRTSSQTPSSPIPKQESSLPPPVSPVIGRSSIPCVSEVSTPTGTEPGGWRVWTASLSQGSTENSYLGWQLKVQPPPGQGRHRTFAVEPRQVEMLGLTHTSKTFRTTDSEEADNCVKLYFGSKFLSVKKSDFSVNTRDPRTAPRHEV